jgi:hypothetical protein
LSYDPPVSEDGAPAPDRYRVSLCAV